MNKIDKILGGLEGKTVTLFGVTYKPNIDDIRESPVMHLMDMLKAKGVNVKVCDPHAAEKVANNFEMYDACKDSDIVVLGVNHDQFRNVDFNKMAENMNNKVILDTRNFWNRDDVTGAGIEYVLLGEGKEEN